MTNLLFFFCKITMSYFGLIWSKNECFWKKNSLYVFTILLFLSLFSSITSFLFCFSNWVFLVNVWARITVYYFSWFNVWIMSFRRWMLKSVLNVEYLFVLLILSVAEFFNLGDLQDIKIISFELRHPYKNEHLNIVCQNLNSH